MEPPGARFERSIPSSLRSLRREMLGMFEEQEERLAEQERRIARQGETILKLEETIAGQQKTIEEQNETIQMIANHPVLRDLFQGIKTKALSPEVLAPTPTTTPTTIGTPLEDSLLFITGGDTSWGFLPSTEVYPRTSGCSPPPLPLDRYGHMTFMTSEPTPLVAACGGSNIRGSFASCLVLDLINQRWDENRMGNLTTVRIDAAAATLNDIGVFIVGGYHANTRRTSEFLAAGTMQWQEGPALPVDMIYPCAVAITPTSFLAIYGTDIREFDAAIAGPNSSEGWMEAGRWPELKTSREDQPGCAKIGQKVIIAGGHNRKDLSSTEVLDLVDRRISSGGEMASPRRRFHLAKIISGGEEKMFAFAGSDGATILNEVEEWVETSSTWKAADNLVGSRRSFGAVAVPRHLICTL